METVFLVILCIAAIGLWVASLARCCKRNFLALALCIILFPIVGVIHGLVTIRKGE